MWNTCAGGDQIACFYWDWPSSEKHSESNGDQYDDRFERFICGENMWVQIRMNSSPIWRLCFSFQLYQMIDAKVWCSSATPSGGEWGVTGSAKLKWSQNILENCREIFWQSLGWYLIENTECRLQESKCFSHYVIQTFSHFVTKILKRIWHQFQIKYKFEFIS